MWSNFIAVNEYSNYSPNKISYRQMFAPRNCANKRIFVRNRLKIMNTRSRTALGSVCFLKTGDSTFVFLTCNLMKIGN